MMNYQKLLSRFYNTGEASNQELQKCDNFPNLPVEEAAAVVAGNGDHVDFDFQPDAEVPLFETEIDANSPTWESSMQDQLSSSTEPISPEQVRWFYKAIDDKIWSEFSGYDSLLIENKYRELIKNNEFKFAKSESTEDIVQLDKVVFNNENNFVNLHTKLDLKKGTDLKDDLNESPVRKSRKNDEKSPQNSGTKLTIESICKKISNFDKIEKSDSNKKYEENVKELNFTENLNVNSITVRGGMYEVDLFTMKCDSIYWPGEQCAITRGLYFYDGSWQPLEGRYGEILEDEHLRLFAPKTVEPPDKMPAQPGVAVHSHHFTDFHVEWLSPSDIYLYWGGAPRQLVRSVTQKLGFYQSTGYRLRRGYRSKASSLERPPDITHVVFVIHGIGQKMDSGRIIRNTNALRTNCDWLRAQYPRFGDREDKGRAELFPARWRAGERGDAADLLAAAAPLGAPALRRAINDAAMDVMYYTSPVYGKQVQDDLTRELNRLYTMFMARNPDYKGYFSAVAHSLGCVILYDIVTGYQIGCERCASMEESKPTENEGLLFNFQQIFLLGSPLGVFLALRQSTSGSTRILPDGFNTRLYNIFHLSDPVAYRLEPLVARWLSEHPPLVIPPHYTVPPTSPSNQASPAKGPWKIWSYVKHPWQRSESGSPIPNINPNSHNFDGTESQSLKSKCNENLSKKISTPVNLESVEMCDKSYMNEKENIHFDVEDDENFNINEEDLEDGDKSKIENTEVIKELSNIARSPEEILPYRIDYTLKDSFITNNYIWAITSHTSYWNNYDVAYFILSHLFPEMNNDGEAEQSIGEHSTMMNIMLLCLIIFMVLGSF